MNISLKNVYHLSYGHIIQTSYKLSDLEMSRSRLKSHKKASKIILRAVTFERIIIEISDLLHFCKTTSYSQGWSPCILTYDVPFSK